MMRQMKRNSIDRSTASMEEYITFLMIWTYIIMILVYDINLKCVGCISNRQNYWTAAAFVGGSSLLTFLLTKRNRWFSQGIFGPLSGALGYTLYIYWVTQRELCLFFIVVAFIILLLGVVLYLFLGARRHTNKLNFKYLMSRVTKSLYLSRMLIAGLCIVASVVMGNSYQTKVNQYYEIGKIGEVNLNDDSKLYENFKSDSIPAKKNYAEEDYYVNAVYGDECRLSNNIERIKHVADEIEWTTLDLKTKQDCVVAIIECQARYKGIPHNLTVNFSDDMDYEKKGFYSPMKKMISINNDLLRYDSAKECLICALHEVRHCEQRAMVEIYSRLSPEERNLICFDGVGEWCKNFNEYVDVDKNEDVINYYRQIVEVDARKDSVKEAELFLDEIEYVLKNSN